MSRSCHSATFSTAAWALPRSTRARPHDALARRSGCACAASRASPSAARRGTAPRPRGPRCAGGGGSRSRAARARRRRARSPAAAAAWRSRGTTWVETCSAREPEPREHARLEVGVGRRVGPDRAGERADRRPGRRPRCEALARCGRPRTRSPASLMPNVVGSACTPCVRPTQTVSTCSRARSASARDEPARAGDDDLARARGSAARAPCRARPTRSGRSGSSARTGPALALSTSTNAATSWSVTASRSLTASTVNVAARIASRSSARRAGHLLAGGDLDPPPGLHPRLVGPERADLGARVAIDHGTMVVSRARSTAAARAAPGGRSRGASRTPPLTATAIAWHTIRLGDVERAAAGRAEDRRGDLRREPEHQPRSARRQPSVAPPRALHDLGALAHRAPARPSSAAAWSRSSATSQIPGDDRSGARHARLEDSAARRRTGAGLTQGHQRSP